MNSGAGANVRPGRGARRAGAIAVAALAVGACAREPAPAWRVDGGDPVRGRAVIARAGCGACHVVPGVPGARGHGGPPLIAFGERVNVAGLLPNTPDQLVRWIRTPQAVLPGNAMPDSGLDEREARDVAAYLYTLRGG